MRTRPIRKRPAAAITLLLMAASLVEAIVATGIPAHGSACDPPPTSTPTSTGTPLPTPTQTSTGTPLPTPTITLPAGPASRPAARPADPLPTGSALPTILPSSTPTPTATPTPTDTPTPDACPTATSVTISVSKTAATWGYRFRFSGKVICSAAVDPLDVALERRFTGESAWRTITAHATDAQFEYLLEDVPSRSADYRVKYLPGQQSLCDPATSSLIHVGVRPGIIFTTSDATPSAGRAVRLSGKVLPAHAGKRVTLQMLMHDGWHNTATATLDSSSAYGFTYRKSSPGSLLFRIAYGTQDPDHLWNVSRNRKITWS